MADEPVSGWTASSTVSLVPSASMAATLCGSEKKEYTRERFVYDLDRLMEQDHPSTNLWDPDDPTGE